MSAVWGRNFTVTIFGESHGAALGAVVDGLPAGLAVNMDKLRQEAARRAPGKSDVSTQRREADDFEILSGIFNGRVTGAPLAFIIRNGGTRSADYERTKTLMRPSHADYTAHVKYGGSADYRGGGHFSGRVTAPLTIAGALARQYLETKGVEIAAHIKSIASIDDARPDDMNELKAASRELFPVLDKAAGERMRRAITDAAADGDSVGGIVECMAWGIPAGLGEPFFDSVESTLSHLLFSVPAVKGVEFGIGAAFATMRGSDANDAFMVENGEIRTTTNNNGGALGGITNGMPLSFSAVIKPTPSIARRQNTVDISTGENAEIEIVGRHDPCIVPRAVPVIEAVCAVALTDLFITAQKM